MNSYGYPVWRKWEGTWLVATSKVFGRVDPVIIKLEAFCIRCTLGYTGVQSSWTSKTRMIQSIDLNLLDWSTRGSQINIGHEVLFMIYSNFNPFTMRGSSTGLTRGYLKARQSPQFCLTSSYIWFWKGWVKALTSLLTFGIKFLPMPTILSSSSLMLMKQSPWSRNCLADVLFWQGRLSNL